MTRTDWQLAVLDLAGTTVRDEGMVEAAVAAAVETVEPGRSVSAADFADSRGKPKRALFEALFPDRPETAARALEHFDDDLLRRAGSGAVTAVSGAEQAIRRISDHGVRICLVTGFSDQVTRAILDSLGWTGLAQEVLTPASVARGRPSPDLVLTAALHAQVDAMSRVVVCGDTENDLLAGSRAGAGLVAGVLTGAHGRDRLAAAPHTHLLASIADLPEALVEFVP